MWWTRIAAAAVAGLALPVAACSGSPSNGGGSTGAQQLAFSQCMRSHGVASFPDPGSTGRIPKETAQQLGVTSSQLQTAQSACAALLPNAGSGPSAAVLRQSWSDMAAFARCMRSHGTPNWPDPTAYPDHPDRPTFDLQSAGIDANSPQVGSGIHECVPLLHGNNPQHLGEAGS